MPEPAEEDATLFRDATRGVRPVSDGNRCLLEADKPPPLPRPRSAEADNEPAARAADTPGDDRAAFRQAMNGVVPLPQSNRAELSAPPPAPTAGPRAGDELSMRLPDEAEAPGQDLLKWALAGVQPLKTGPRAELGPPPPSPRPRQREEDERAVLRESIEAPLSLEDRLETGDEAVFLRPGLPRRVLTDLRRGRWVLQRELDLHGLTRELARAALAEFLAACLREGLRCVRLIHGKGLGSPGRFGVLKHLSRGWLAQREEILAFCQAREHEGGSGALLVLLRASEAGRRNPAP